MPVKIWLLDTSKLMGKGTDVKMFGNKFYFWMLQFFNVGAPNPTPALPQPGKDRVKTQIKAVEKNLKRFEIRRKKCVKNISTESLR